MKIKHRYPLHLGNIARFALLCGLLPFAIELRKEALWQLHQDQVRLLAEWRGDPAEETLRALLLTVNAIGMGQKMTG